MLLLQRTWQYSGVLGKFCMLIERPSSEGLRFCMTSDWEKLLEPSLRRKRKCPSAVDFICIVNDTFMRANDF